MAEKSRMIFGNVLRGKFGGDLVGEWRPPSARYVAAAVGGGCSMRAVPPVLVQNYTQCRDRKVGKVADRSLILDSRHPGILSVLRSRRTGLKPLSTPTCRIWPHIGHVAKNLRLL